ncbi:hypothetical protein KAJ41_02100, partial [Candidatus Parcubacteria bacterium]|nr:hypothetical protein [Candidatus Parcubacteria bacterium]
KSFCDIFIYEPENIEEQSLGSLYILGEVVNFPSNSSYLINLLASIAKKEFYSDSKRSTTESLEASLHKVNSTLSDMAEQGNIDWIGNLNMIFSVYKNEELHLSQTGEIKTILIRDEQITDIGKNITTDKNSHPMRTFANIASGELEIGDLVLFTTPELFNVFSTEKLRQLSSSLNIEELAESVQDAIEKEKNVNTMGLFIMKVEEDKKEEFVHTEIKSEIVAKDESSIPVPLKEVEEKNNNLSKEAINDKRSGNEKRISLEDIIKEYETDNKDTEKNIKKLEPEAIKVQKKDYFLENTNIIKKEKNEETDEFLQALEDGHDISLLDNISNKLKSLVGKERLLHFVNRISENVTNFRKTIKLKSLKSESDTRSHSLSKGKRVILTAFIVIVVILTGGLLSENKRRLNEENLQKYSNLIIETEEKIAEAEIESINSSSDARKYLLEARVILKGKDHSLTGKIYQDLNSKTNELNNKIQDRLDILDHVEKIENPIVALDLDQSEDIKNAKKIFKSDEEYFVLGQDYKIFSKINFDKNNVSNLDINNIENVILSSYMKKTNEIIFLNDKQDVTILNLDKKTTLKESINLIEGNSVAKSIASYSNFLYLLVPESNQIYKYKRLTNGFDSGAEWLDEEVDIRNSVSMAIDGSIYLLNSNGSIQKLRTGGQELFEIEAPSDPISKTAKIYTNSNLKHLYITNAKKKRIVIFDKTSGKLIKQYTSVKFDNMKNIVVSSEEDKIYILNAAKIFEIDIKI